MATTEENIKKIKQSFRLLMNGVTAQSMREKGVDYHLNWGANLLHLRDLAKEYEPSYDLAVGLWKENIRECKILATMLMPHDEFTSDLAWLWIEQLPSQEIAELLASNLLQHQSFASDLAFQLFAEKDVLPRLTGYTLISFLFKKGMEPNERDINEYIDQATSALREESVPLRHTVLKSLQHFASLGDMHAMIARGALRPLELDDWI